MGVKLLKFSLFLFFSAKRGLELSCCAQNHNMTEESVTQTLYGSQCLKIFKIGPSSVYSVLRNNSMCTWLESVSRRELASVDLPKCQKQLVWRSLLFFYGSLLFPEQPNSIFFRNTDRL